MSKKIIFILGIAYTIVTLILNNVLQTTVGGFMMTLSFLALVVAIIVAIYSLIKFAIRQLFDNRKNRSSI